MTSDTKDVRNIPFIDLRGQYQQLKPAIDNRIQSVLDHGQFIMGPEVSELESTLATYTGADHCIGVSDGTTALMIAMMALDIGHGDEVITTPFTFIATGEMISLLGAVPVFVDICEDTYNIDPDKIESAITAKTKAILAVSLYGQCADFDRINAIAAKHQLPVIEDAAQSFGATLNGKKSCALTTIATTSFFPSKPLGCYGDGGACFTNDPVLAEKMRQIRVHGQSKRYVHSSLGLNGRLDTLQAAILLAKFDAFPKEVKQRAEVGARYSTLIKEYTGKDVVAPQTIPGATSVFAQYTVRVRHREKVREALAADGIPTAVHYPICLHQQTVYETLPYRISAAPVAELAAAEVMSLPMHPAISDELQRFIVEKLMSAVTSTG